MKNNSLSARGSLTEKTNKLMFHVVVICPLEKAVVRSAVPGADTVWLILRRRERLSEFNSV